jgi:phospholipase/carboxylesterase
MLQRKNLTLTFLDSAPSRQENTPLMIMLHGYGSNEKDLMQLAPMLHQRMHYISARAPRMLDFGMFGWFPIQFTPDGIIVDYPAAEEAVEKLVAFIREIIDAYSPSGGRVYLMGFSQGSVMSYLTAFHAPELLHGVIALSGHLPEKAMPDGKVKPELRTLPFLVAHGIYDDILPIAKGRQSKDWLQRHTDDLIYREFPIGHQISDEGIDLIRSWLGEKAPKTESKA